MHTPNSDPSLLEVWKSKSIKYQLKGLTRNQAYKRIAKEYNCNRNLVEYYLNPERKKQMKFASTQSYHKRHRQWKNYLEIVNELRTLIIDTFYDSENIEKNLIIKNIQNENNSEIINKILDITLSDLPLEEINSNSKLYRIIQPKG